MATFGFAGGGAIGAGALLGLRAPGHPIIVVGLSLNRVRSIASEFLSTRRAYYASAGTLVPAVLPVLAHAETTRSWVGIEGITPDELPIIEADGSIEETMFSRTARVLAENGIASLRIDFRGSGESTDGFTFAETTFTSQVSDALAAVEYLDRRPGPLASALRAGVLSLPLGPDAIQKAMEDAGAREAGWMKRSLRQLSAIAQLAPLLGLLGTVYGMIAAFQAAASVAVGRGDQLPAGIYDALLTTAAGLTVAIPTLIAHQMLMGRVGRLIDAMEEAVVGFLQELRTRALAREARRSGP